MASITLLPDSDDQTLCLQMTGQITPDEFENKYRQEIEKRIDKNGYFNMLVYYDRNFKGWDPQAAEMNLKAIITLGRKPRKLAYVNPQKSKIMLMKLAQPILEGEIRYFAEDELAEALH